MVQNLEDDTVAQRMDSEPDPAWAGLASLANVTGAAMVPEAWRHIDVALAEPATRFPPTGMAPRPPRSPGNWSA